MANEQETYKYLPAKLAQKLQVAGISVRKPMAGMRQSQHRSDSLGASVEFAEYREYHPGDPLKRIDWSVYARTDRYVIREAFKEVSARCFVLLDVSRSMDFSHSGPMTKLDYAKYLAAAMMFVMVNQNDSAALITFDNDMKEYFEPTTTPMGLKPALQHLEEAEAAGAGNIEAALHKTAELVSGRSFIVIISDFLQSSEEVLRGFHHLHHDGMDVTVFHIMDPSELTLPMSGLTELKDMESDEKLTVDIEEVRDMYVMQVNRHIEYLQKNCMNMQMDYLFSDTNKPVHELILQRSF